MTLLQRRTAHRHQRRLEAYDETRRRLKSALREILPAQPVILFGSLTRPGVFNDCSDIDLALEQEPPHLNSWQLTAALMEYLERPVDVVLLEKCRFREKILREGERWTP